MRAAAVAVLAALLVALPGAVTGAEAPKPELAAGGTIQKSYVASGFAVQLGEGSVHGASLLATQFVLPANANVVSARAKDDVRPYTGLGLCVNLDPVPECNLLGFDSAYLRLNGITIPAGTTVDVFVYSFAANFPRSTPAAATAGKLTLTWS